MKLGRDGDWSLIEGLDLGFVTQIIQHRKRQIDPGQSVNRGGTKNPGRPVNDFALEVSVTNDPA